MNLFHYTIIIFLQYIQSINNKIKCFQKMLMFDSTERISAREALKHPYFNEIEI